MTTKYRRGTTSSPVLPNQFRTRVCLRQVRPVEEEVLPRRRSQLKISPRDGEEIGEGSLTEGHSHHAWV